MPIPITPSETQIQILVSLPNLLLPLAFKMFLPGAIVFGPSKFFAGGLRQGF